MKNARYEVCRHQFVSVCDHIISKIYDSYEDIKDKLKGDAITIQGKNNFVNSIKKEITAKLFSTGLYSKVKNCLNDVLNDLYTNIQLFM